MNPSIKRIRGSDGAGNASVMTVQADRAALSTTIIVDTVLNVPDEFIGTWGTPHTFQDPITGEEITVISEASAVDFRGHVDGGNIEIDQVSPGYTDNGNSVGDIIIIKPTTDWSNNVANILDVSMNDDGTLKAVVDNPGWTELPVNPSTVTANGNRSYDLVFNGTDLTGTLSPGMRLKTTRLVTAPTQCTSLNGTNQYYSKSSPNGMTFTDDFVVSAWVKLNSYGANSYIASRYNGTSGWNFAIDSSGRVALWGNNGGGVNFSQITSFQSIPLNKWVHISAQLDMSAFTATTTTSYVMIDGVDVPASVSRGGTNPTALVQAGDLNIGASNANGFFPGKIAQVAIYNAKVTQANIRATISQGLSGTETSLISAYSFNNSITDLNTTNANNLTANGSAVATNADSPFSINSFGTATGTTDYAIIQKATFSTNTTLTVQVPEGNTIPTSGGVSAVSYSTQKAPYGMPIERSKWRISTNLLTNNYTTSNANYGAFSSGQYSITVPIGSWDVGQRGGYLNATNTSVYFNLSPVSLTGLSATAGGQQSPCVVRTLSPAAAASVIYGDCKVTATLSTATQYVVYTLGATVSAGIEATNQPAELYAENAYL